MVTKTPPLSLVSSGATTTSPPRALRVHGRTLWDAVMSEYQIDDIGGIEVLAQICAAVDRAEDLAAQVNIDGCVIMTKSGPREHPALRAELGCRSFVTRNLQRLGLNIETLKPVGRPPGFGPVSS
jgi:hypothetical protein